jgi:Co/Zn/Cd efflux system component
MYEYVKVWILTIHRYSELLAFPTKRIHLLARAEYILIEALERFSSNPLFRALNSVLDGQ